MSKRPTGPFADGVTRVAACRLPLGTYARLSAVAIANGTTPGEILRELVDRMLRERRKRIA